MKKFLGSKIFFLTILSFGFFGLVQNSKAVESICPDGSDPNSNVIFCDDFEWGSDWNSSMSDALPGEHGWGAVQMDNRGGFKEAAYVNSAQAKQGEMSFIQYWDKTMGYENAQNIWLLQGEYYPGINYPDEWYWGYWFKIDPNWEWGSAASLKIAKLQFNDETTWDINWAASCYTGSDYGWLSAPSGEGYAICTNEYGNNNFGGWNSIDDGEWHYFVWHVKHSTNTLELKIDGSNAKNYSNAPVFPGTGMNDKFNFGGNISNGGGDVAEMWTAYDDVIIAKTELEVENFLGVGAGGDTTPPAAPSGLSVQ